jgi:hypothetical protein
MDGCEISSAVQACQFDRVAFIVLDPIAALLRQQRGRGDQALDAQLRQAAGNPKAAWSGLVADTQVTPLAFELRQQPLEYVEIVADRPIRAHFPITFRFSERYGDRILVDIKTDIEQFFHALTLHETVFLGTSIGSAGLPLAALFRLVRNNPRFGPAG